MMRHHQRSPWLDQPREISIETYAQCNASCNFCPYPTLDRKGTKMPDALLDKLVGEIAEMRKSTLWVSPFKVNEPFLDSRIIPLCERLNREAPHVRIRLFTNGSPLVDSKIEAVAGLKNIEHLWVSLNSHIPEEYARIMGLKFDLTAKRLDRLHEYVGEGKFPHQVVLSAVGFPNEPFRRYCFDRWPLFMAVAIKRDAWIDYTDPQSASVPSTPCMRWEELSIMADGRVSLCCMDGTGKYAIGDVNSQTMLEVYNSPRWRLLRVNRTNRHEAADPCNRCTY